MTYEKAIHKIDFLNERLHKFRTPWYQWSIKIDWNKIDKWCKFFGYGGGLLNENKD